MALFRLPLRPVLLALVGVTLLFLAGDTALWLWATTRMGQVLAEWQAVQDARGLSVTHGNPAWAGWPFDAELRLPQAAITAGLGREGQTWSWHVDVVTLTLSPWHPDRLEVVPSGSQRLTLGQAAPLPASASRLDVQVPLSDDPEAAVHATGRGIQITLPGGVVVVGNADMQLDPSHLALSLQDLLLPLANLPFAGGVAALSAEATTSVPWPLAADLQGSAIAWRKAGGRLLIQHAALRWGSLDVQATGALSLDPALQPQGSATLHMTGYDGLIEALVRTGAVSHNDARVASTLLGLMAHTPPGAPASVDLPLTVQDCLVSAGAIPLMKLPHLWTP